jgi:hypothetical protein
METRKITVRATTGSPEEVEVCDRDASDEAMDASYARVREVDGYDRNGAFDGFQVVSDAEGCL